MLFLKILFWVSLVFFILMKGYDCPPEQEESKKSICRKVGIFLIILAICIFGLE